MKNKTLFVFVILGLVPFLILKGNIFSLKKIAFLLLYAPGVYLLLFSKGLYYGNIDISYTRMINILLGIVLLISSIVCLLGPNYR